MIGLKTHKVTIGDSLQKLARMYNIENWQEIAELNSLTSPYIDSRFPLEGESSEGIARVGDILVIPSLGTVDVVTHKNNREVEALAYGKDLDLYHNEPVFHDVKGHLKEGDRDIKTVTGLENLAQQLMTRLSVKKGALLMHPDFGSNLHLYAGKLDSQENRNKIMWEVESCIRSDFRVNDVIDINVVFKSGKTYVQAKIIPIEPGSPFDLTYYLDK